MKLIGRPLASHFFSASTSLRVVGRIKGGGTHTSPGSLEEGQDKNVRDKKNVAISRCMPLYSLAILPTKFEGWSQLNCLFIDILAPEAEKPKLFFPNSLQKKHPGLTQNLPPDGN